MVHARAPGDAAITAYNPVILPITERNFLSTIVFAVVVMAATNVCPADQWWATLKVSRHNLGAIPAVYSFLRDSGETYVT